ncbi:MAG: hypothetical protein RLZZ303_2059 [Candidatus Hydrogenedentota bacterium]|jgi:hypothetical protein
MDETPPPQIYRAKGDSALRGCLIGCLALVFAGLLLVGLLLFAVYNLLSGVMDEFTAEAPRELPVAELPELDKELLFGKVDTFGRALTGNDLALEPLELTGEEINVLLREYPQPHSTYDWIAVSIVDGLLRADLSLPLEPFGLRGRYLNGSGELETRLSGGQLAVYINRIEVNGQPLPGQMLAFLRQWNLAQDMVADAQTQQVLDRIESIQIIDNRLVITPVPQITYP